jgi:hypothetical protein
MATITIPKKLAPKDDRAVTENNVLRWAREARRLGKAGKLPLLSALARDLSHAETEIRRGEGTPQEEVFERYGI